MVTPQAIVLLTATMLAIRWAITADMMVVTMEDTMSTMTTITDTVITAMGMVDLVVPATMVVLVVMEVLVGLAAPEDTAFITADMGIENN